MSVSQADIAHWRGWIGRRETREELLCPEALRRYAHAIGEDADAGWPSLGHWAFFLPAAADQDLGPDGHTKRGGFMPPVSLPRRMFAAAALRFERPLEAGAPASLVAEITDLAHKAGRSGDLVFVTVERRIEQAGALCVRETQTIVFRGAGAALAPVAEASPPPQGESWRPGPAALFRFSAATNNAHRIHYDGAYARDVEGYPGLVVHGPFIAAKLCGYARRIAGRAPAAFAFRALAPAFVDQPIALRQGESEHEVVAVRADGETAMTASLGY